MCRLHVPGGFGWLTGWSSNWLGLGVLGPIAPGHSGGAAGAEANATRGLHTGTTLAEWVELKQACVQRSQGSLSWDTLMGRKW